MQISNNGDLLISINGKTKLLSKEDIIKLYNNNHINYSYFITHTANNIELTGDTVVDEIREKFLERSKKGQTKYGTNLDRKDLSIIEWLNNAIEEQMDSILYLTKLKRELYENNNRRKL